jgi:hypothetical protein
MTPLPVLRLKPLEASERQILAAILRYLRVERRVSWFERFNTGAGVAESMDKHGRVRRRFIRFAFKGCSDILGQLADGRLLAIEVKSRLGVISDEQAVFIARVKAAGGFALVARSVDDVVAALNTYWSRPR